jgi:hypothetical protein
MVLATLANRGAQAALIPFSGMSFDGDNVSGTADVTPGTNTLTIKLTNTTAITNDAGELLTGLDFALGGLTPTLTSATAIKRTVNENGSFSDASGAVSISWQLVSVGNGGYQINFNPNAKDAILAPPFGSVPNYSGSNASVRGNPGHNPYAAQLATFIFNVPGMTAASQVNINVFRFGTGLQAAQRIVPEPAAVALLMMGLALITCRRRDRAR